MTIHAKIRAIIQNLHSFITIFILWHSSLLISAQALIKVPLSLTIVDTYGKDAYAYRNLQFLAQSVGFDVKYKNLYGLIESPHIPPSDVAVILVNHAMLSDSDHPLVAQWIKAIQLFIEQPNKSIVLLLPQRLKYDTNNIKLINALLQKIGVISCKKTVTTKTIHTFLQSLKTESAIGSLYGTSLLPAKPTLQNSTNSRARLLVTCPTTKSIIARETPHELTNYSPKARQTLPAGLMWKIPHNNSTVLLAPAHIFTFADREEDCMKVSVNMQDRNELLTIAQHILNELYSAHTTGSLEVHTTKLPVLPHFFTEAYIQRTKEKAEQQIHATINTGRYGWIIKDGISCAWIDPNDLFGQEDPHKKLPARMKKSLKKEFGRAYPADIESAVEEYALETGMNFLYNAQFNLWWITYLPEYYLIKQGRFNEKQEEFIKQMDIITEAIPQYAMQQEKKLPQIFVGLNLTSNFKNNPVKHPVADVYGKSYSHIPCPLDWDNFWQPEVVEPFTLFSDLAYGLPIAGVFLDFEMYHAQNQANSFTDQFDFSDYAWQIYCEQVSNPSANQYPTVAHRVAYLAREKKFTQYFKILECHAEKIGVRLKNSFRTTNPNILIGAYAPTLPNSWFYRGLLRGLSSQQEPVIYATFNTDYYSHHAWLTANGIHLLHGSVIMLSKFTTKNSFEIIPYTKSHHYFVWYNHPSRMVYGYNQQELDHDNWWGIEASPLTAIEVARGITNVSQSNTRN